MPTGFVNKTIVFPPMTAQQEAQLKSLMTKIGEFMGDKIETSAQIVVTVAVPADRADIATVVSRVRAAMERPPAKQPETEDKTNE